MFKHLKVYFRLIFKSIIYDNINTIQILNKLHQSTEIFFASYGKEDHTDIYKARIMADGSFSEPQKLSGSVNSKFDEDFPFMHPDGQTLYFSSKGHNSMGGFDVFKSKLTSGNQFNAPINLDFAINSPDDDIFYIVTAWK